MGVCVAEDGPHGFAAGFEERGGAFGVLVGELHGVGDDVAEGGEGLGVELVAHGVAAGGVDALGVGDGGAELVAGGDGVELVEGEVVGPADERGGHGRVEEVLEQVLGELGWCGVHDRPCGFGELVG